MKIAIASGKGGTGKTTITTNLALSLGAVQVLDCDVEEPNANIFLNMPLAKIKDVTIAVAKIDESRCTYCGACADFCQYNAIAVVPSKILFFPELCKGCGGCMRVCPEKAISETEKSIGIIEHGRRNGIEFYHGVLNVGEALSTPLIKALKKHIDESKTVLLDSPPGTACPVIETMRGSDFCLLVTEPTPFGLHDLKLAVATVRALNIPFGVIVNRDGIGDDRVERYCAEEGITLMLKIPQDRRIAELYSNGIPFVKELPEWKERFIKMMRDIEHHVAEQGGST